VNSVSHYLKDQPTAGRFWVYLALTGAAQILALITSLSQTGALILAVVVVVGVDLVIWLRNNPTLKQMERRKLKQNESSHQSKGDESG